jgi:hypothetical protein
VRRESRIEGTPHVVGAKTIFASGHILDLGIREWHRSVAAKQESVVTRTRFVQTMASLMQTEGF